MSAPTAVPQPSAAEPGGLSEAEAARRLEQYGHNELPSAKRRDVLRIALDSGKAVGLEVTIYNPDLDEHGAAGRALADLLAEALGTSAPTG